MCSKNADKLTSEVMEFKPSFKMATHRLDYLSTLHLKYIPWVSVSVIQ